MKVGLDARYIYSDHVHGIGRFSHGLIRALAQADDQNSYVVFKRRALVSPLTTGRNFREVSCRSAPVSPYTLLLLSRVVRRHDLAIFHSLFPIAPLRSVAKRVVTVHDLQAVQIRSFSARRFPVLAWGAGLFYRFAYGASITRAERIVADSEATKSDVVAQYGLPADRVTVVYPGIDARFGPCTNAVVLDQARSKYRLPGEFLLNVGNTRPHKNVKGLLGGYAHYARMTGTPLPLVLVGFKDRFLSDVQALVQQLGLAEWVTFLGYVPDEDLPLIYSLAELFITTSLKEGFGLPVLESMACGTPVVVSDVASLPEIVGRAGVLVNPHSAEDIGAALRRVLQDEALLAKLRQDGLVRARSFSWQRAAEQTLAVYQDLMSEGAAESKRIG